MERPVTGDNIRPNRLFTADRKLVLYAGCHVTAGKLAQVVDRVVEILKG